MLNILFDFSVLPPLSIVIAVLIIAAFKYFPIQQLLYKCNAASSRDYTACNSPECIRCQKYAVITTTAYDKLQKYALEHRSNGLERLSRSLTRAHDIVYENKLQQPNVLYIPTLKSEPYWSNEEFATDVCLLESKTGVILEEYHQIQKSTSGWLTNNTSCGCWEAFFLFNQGVKVDDNCDLCPETTSLIVNKLTSLMSGCVFGNVFFSRVYPRTSIAAHYGPSNVRLRCHLGLDVTDDCFIEVAGMRQCWMVGKCLVFDDSFLHSVSHTSDQGSIRAILIVDLWHPDVTCAEQAAIQHIFSII